MADPGVARRGKEARRGTAGAPGAFRKTCSTSSTGGPDGGIRYYWLLEKGKLLESRLGELPDAEVTLTESYEDAMRIQKNELDANAAFMQGRVKVTGNMAKLMAMLPITNSAEYKQLQVDVLEITEF